jgi:hypothetical protein
MARELTENITARGAPLTPVILVLVFTAGLAKLAWLSSGGVP